VDDVSCLAHMAVVTSEVYIHETRFIFVFMLSLCSSDGKNRFESIHRTESIRLANRMGNFLIWML